MNYLLEIYSLKKKIGNLDLKNININLPPGYIMGLVGVNGSGKTTLINTILNIYKKDSGTVKVNEFSMDTNEREAKNEIGFVLDENMFENTITVINNAKIFGKLYSKFNYKLFYKLCSKFDLPIKKKLGKLSTGQKTKFQLAFALSHDAKLFIMDEPSSGLNPVFRQELINYMQELVEDGTRSVLFSTHITEDLDKIGDYITLINNGEIFFCLDKEALKEKYLILNGTKEQIENLNCSKIIYREYGEYHNSAFIEKEIDAIYNNLNLKTPTIEDIMYYLEKGGYTYA